MDLPHPRRGVSLRRGTIRQRMGLLHIVCIRGCTRQQKKSSDGYTSPSPMPKQNRGGSVRALFAYFLRAAGHMTGEAITTGRVKRNVTFLSQRPIRLLVESDVRPSVEESLTWTKGLVG